MSVSDNVRIFICFTAAERCYECVCQKSRSFNDILPEVYRMFQTELMDRYRLEDYLVYEKNSGILCDTHVSLNSLGVRSGMIFQIF